MAAMLSLSLGAVYPLPMTWRGTIKKPAAAIEPCLMKFLLLFCFGYDYGFIFRLMMNVSKNCDSFLMKV